MRADVITIHYFELPRSCTLQRASRLRRTYLFNKLHSPTSVPSTPNTLFKTRVSAGLQQMLVCLKTCCLAYTKHRLWVVLCEAQPSRAESVRAKPAQSREFWNIRPMKISTPEIHKKGKMSISGPMYSWNYFGYVDDLFASVVIFFLV